MRGTLFLFFDVIFYAIAIIFVPVLRVADRLFEKSVDWLLKHQQRWQKYWRFAPALSLAPGFVLNTDRCFVRFHRLLMRFCRRQSGHGESHSMRSGFGVNDSASLLMAS